MGDRSEVGKALGAAPARRTNREWAIDRRGFLRAITTMGAASAGLVAAGALAGCNVEEGYSAYEALVTGEREVVDHAGRTVKIPTAAALERIYFTSGLAQIWVFSLNPDKQGGTSAQYSDDQLQFLPEGMDKLTYMGAISENAQIDVEMLRASDIQLIFSISGVALTESNVSDAESLQEQTGIPVVLVDGSFERIAESYRFVGDIMGEPERAEEVATYCEQKFAEVTAAVAKVPEDERVNIYYAEGVEGLQTDPEQSQHALTFKLAGANNVAQVAVQSFGMSNVDMERVRAWDPEVIFAWADRHGGADKLIRESPDWADIRAVKDGRVYTVPAAPFNWVDRPPGVNRLIGVQWVANVLYPQHYDVDMVEVTKDFYKKMYWADVTDEQARDLLGNSYRA